MSKLKVGDRVRVRLQEVSMKYIRSTYNVTPSDIISVAFALAVGNFVYQMPLADPNWAQAAERSFFQSIAMFALLAWKEITQ